MNNVAPAPSVASVGGVRREGTAVAVGASATDPAGDNDTLSYAWAVYKDGSASPFALGTGAGWAFTPDDNGDYRVVLTAADEDGGSAGTEQTIALANAAPSVTVTGPAAGRLVAVGTPVTLTGASGDPGAADTHTATWALDGSAFDAGVAAAPGGVGGGSGGTGTVTGTHTFTGAGVYTVRLAVSDDDGGVATAADTVGGFEATVVVYDPSAGFVTGGGWIGSPVGAYAADPTLAGRATFGFVSRYKKGAGTPTGNTQFQFRAGNLNFHGDGYGWMVVNGHKAQYKRTGSVNGVAGYQFMLTATDGGVSGGGGGGGGVDRFRIRIWGPDDGLVYDNLVGGADSDDRSTSLGGGSIVIHAG